MLPGRRWCASGGFFFAQARLRVLAAHLGGHSRLGPLRPAADDLPAQVAHPLDDLPRSRRPWGAATRPGSASTPPALPRTPSSAGCACRALSRRFFSGGNRQGLAHAGQLATDFSSPLLPRTFNCTPYPPPPAFPPCATLYPRYVCPSLHPRRLMRGLDPRETAVSSRNPTTSQPQPAGRPAAAFFAQQPPPVVFSHPKPKL